MILFSAVVVVAAIVVAFVLTRAYRQIAALKKRQRLLEQQATDIMQMKKDFISYVSHELKAPLASMQETTHLLLERIPGPLTDKQNRLLDLNLQSGKKLAGMIGNLLDLSRLEAGIVEYEMHEQDVAELVRSVISDHAGKTAENMARITSNFPAERIILRCDSTRLMQSLEKVLENAIRFSGKDGSVRVDVRAVRDFPGKMPTNLQRRVPRGPDGDFVLISVSDSGPGIEDQRKESVFEGFYQGQHSRKRHGQNLGLGLVIARVLVEAHCGAIWVEDNPAGGSVFQILFPIAETESYGLSQVS